MITLTCHGAAKEVTGSRHLLEINGKRLLLDCGMHQGGDLTKRLRRDALPFKARDIDAVVLSHAHLDHSGALPRLLRRGYRGVIYCTGATLNLLAVLLKDACNLYLKDLERDNRVRQRRGQKVQKPVYDMEDVLAVLEACHVVPYGVPKEILPGVIVTLLDAGHILGAAMVHLQLDDGGPKGPLRLLFSGDLGNSDSPLMRDPAPVPEVDWVMMESTYGDRNHRSYPDTLNELEGVLEAARGGVVLVPAFAVGRTQEVLFQLGCFYHQGKLEGWHVVLDSPMAIEVTQIYDQWLELMDKEDLNRLTEQGSATLEAFLPCLHLTQNTDDSIALNRVNQGLIIIAGSGMCNGGRMVHHLKHRVWHDKTHIMFTGFQARGTVGRQLVEGEPRIKLFGQTFAVRAQIHTLGGFSAHADQRQLLAWLAAIPGHPKVLLVHGEEEAQRVLWEAIEASSGHSVAIPGVGETITLRD
ncbi:MBL fold metallo-hydrolase RNA specificity domain-containing protein [Ferrimonas balearica]|uniref:MBL fold metallo-hydrolase RNA specificity domain-containing protein n=1 Tax=Ferrimonas balearica TaxID=44012 RepID=UPI001C9906FF|nr:MBL fold metallo-hydrolase [Ferrimonas balearica]MBY5921005.1 MBL fold metallo-hydrolase [Ferrimonas balearica]MBY5996310.1 MBL fold metallo-hydrolase [Ferrimonas balearica]